MTEEHIVEAIRRHLDREGKLSCAAAFRVVEELGVEPLEVGRAADDIGVRLSRCQLGLFGYGPKAEGRHKVVKPAEVVEPGVAQAIRDGLRDGGLSCEAAWEIAGVLRVSRMDVAAAAEALGVKIVRCQLGAF
ncbi:MAG TPA: hypothetical protein EYH30_02750 [Anaerolineales bacterium]|nr:hypothetical protein [Anaerolineae bacterium]HIQ01041.1 hypothetical protein [Anaerolineales bacterium]